MITGDRRHAALTLAFAIGGFLATAGLLHALTVAVSLPRDRQNPVNAARVLSLKWLGERIARTGPPAVLFLGDSLVQPTSTGRDDVMAELIDILLAQGVRLPEAGFRNTAKPGMRLHAQYLASDVYAAAGARTIVMSINPGWFQVKNEPGAEVAALFPESRWWEAMKMPLHEAGLSADRLLLYRALGRAGGIPLWAQVQLEQQSHARLANHLADRLRNAARKLVPVEAPADVLARVRMQSTWGRTNARGAARPSRLAAERRLGPFFHGLSADDPRLRMLGAAVARWSESGSKVLAYVAPTNVEDLKSLGIYDEEGAQKSLTELQSVIEGAGGDFLDLHDILPDASFKDAGDHLDFRVKPKPSRVLAERLEPWVLQNAFPDQAG